MSRRLHRLGLLLGLATAAPLSTIGHLAMSQSAPSADVTSQPAPQADSTAPVLPPYLRAELYPKWISPQAQIKWPPNDGFVSAPAAATLPPGTLIDRFGSENGSFFSPVGDSFAARALPYVCSRMPYTAYRVVKPVPVKAGKAAPWFDEPGGATQYQTNEPAFKLRDEGMIEVAKSDSAGNAKPAAPCSGP